MQNLRQWLKSNQGIGVMVSLFFLAFLVYLLLSPWVYTKLGDGFRLGFFPILSVVLILLPSLILIFDSHRKETPADLKILSFKSFLVVLLLLAGCLFYFVIMNKIGFLIITPFFLFFSIYALGLKSWWKGIIVAVVMTVIVYTMLSLLGLKLPAGILSDILPF
ncbi:MAG: tripartite tricarboxylate transporter TctB family protein [Thermodesulfobacteriota bacterium]|nr:tripartite tricarboxylate transporter TctB family protein [Thermodesulfobacteriota bacterium]